MVCYIYKERVLNISDRSYVVLRCVYIYTYIYVYVYIYREREKRDYFVCLI